jgi:hypothetical protein
MAAAFDLVSVVKHQRERVRAKAGGAFGHDREASLARKREEGKLDETERGDLLMLWSGLSALCGMRSVHGSVEDRLLRAPPRKSRRLDKALCDFLRHRGTAGAPREKLVEVLSAEESVTRHEARMLLMGLVTAKRVELFTAEVVRRKPCTCKSPMGEEADAGRRKRKCDCSAGQEESVPCEMARLVAKWDRGAKDEPETDEGRWERQDRELEAFCRQLVPHESRNVGGGGLPPELREGGAGRARAALQAMPPADRKVLEVAYGGGSRGRWEGVLSAEAGRLAPLTDVVERARLGLAGERLKASGVRGPEATRDMQRSTRAVDAMTEVLDDAPAEEEAKAHWARERERFVAALEKEAAAMLARAVKAYRAARERP